MTTHKMEKLFPRTPRTYSLISSVCIVTATGTTSLMFVYWIMSYFVAFDATQFMTILLLLSCSNFWHKAKHLNVTFDRSTIQATILFWVCFFAAYSAMGIYLKATPSMLGVLTGFAVACLVNVVIERFKSRQKHI